MKPSVGRNFWSGVLQCAPLAVLLWVLIGLMLWLVLS
jgi:uncharacterized membrane protein